MNKTAKYRFAERCAAPSSWAIGGLGALLCLGAVLGSSNPLAPSDPAGACRAVLAALPALWGAAMLLERSVDETAWRSLMGAAGGTGEWLGLALSHAVLAAPAWAVWMSAGSQGPSTLDAAAWTATCLVLSAMALAVRAAGLPGGPGACLMLLLAAGAWWAPAGPWGAILGSSVHPARMPAVADPGGIGVPLGAILVYIVRTALAAGLWLTLGHLTRRSPTANGGR